MSKTYKLFSDMRLPEKRLVEKIVGIQQKIQVHSNSIDDLRNERVKYSNKIISYLKSSKYNGIEKSNAVIYTKSVGGATPSFWQVFISVKSKLLPRDAALLERKYLELSENREKRDVLIVQTKE